MKEKARIMDEQAVERALKRIAHEIIEKNDGVKDVGIIGIQRRGVTLGNRIAAYIEEFEGDKVPLGVLDITFYRDDLSLLNAHPVLNGTDVSFDVNNKAIVMVDDVLYTGRTARAAMEAIIDMGRPKSIQLAVLIDRGHRELPIRADYIGKNVPTSKTEIVHVEVTEFDGQNGVIISED
jgi:pyrimidine operon attenuation protein/uracil phosphoribosyltransferase